jgi:hypothetical protein
MSETRLRAIFELAGIPILRLWTLIDGYGYSPDDPRYFETPPRQVWWLVKTPLGLIEVGWRKRVIQIDWSETNIRCDVTSDDVTKHDSMVHAWSEEKAIEYLKVLRSLRLGAFGASA